MLLQGTVQKGRQRGKLLGFPTINIPVFQSIPEGIYLSKITIIGKQYHALTFIGAAKTFGETEILAETYVFDFNKDIYGEMVTVEVLKKIRDNQKFDSEKALIQQMKEDKKQAEEFFATLKEG